ncbi:MAG: hypothetical protein BZY75_00630 [SAR202 cluster bacterium Io17-Chloro-G7]|nr:MAG: hypothetical protein BZY75_00630 [SAR202 cluster bacterium Io17-Chloro-G7]
MRNLSKTLFLNTITCPTLGWELRNEDIIDQDLQAPKTRGELFRVEQGLEIGSRARTLYPTGLLIEEKDMDKAAASTRQAMADPSNRIIFEAAFRVDGTAARADVLIRDGAGWRLVEVKSSANDRGNYIDDMAYTVMVLSQARIEITQASLLLISKDYRLGMSNSDLFVEVDHTEEVLIRAEALRQIWPNIIEETSRTKKPEPVLKIACRKCPLFSQCMGNEVENHVFKIPRLSPKKFDQLTEAGIVRIEDIPATFPLTERQTIMWESVQAQKPTVRDGLGNELAQVMWPAHYLDFESVMTAIPLYPDIAPYSQIPTQYSSHCCDDVGNVISHAEFLCDHTKDSRLELAQRLIEDLPGEGSIIVYSNFEKTIIKGLANILPPLAPSLESLLGRIVDLQDIIIKNFYHPDFGGSVSLKSTLPALVPSMSYSHLNIAEGETAMVTFAYLAMGRYSGQFAETERQNLLEYCKQDTMAMVMLHQRLDEFVRGAA